ncbi:solute carrier family 15 member 4 [Aplysia californica]|uniref:Solute carrier family 15 member 4 n=1 Tax=Aplysia californica TaxID=6500 RepID=A0ABM1A8V3_APLCA|nr:solute carrier family 15 member 4 [Aplysia californica]
MSVSVFDTPMSSWYWKQKGECVTKERVIGINLRYMAEDGVFKKVSDSTKTMEGSGDTDSQGAAHEGSKPPLTVASNGPCQTDGMDTEFTISSSLKRRTLTAALVILFAQFMERTAFYGVVSNMILFCTSNLGFDTVNATTVSLVFLGFVYLFPVLGGWVSDSYTGRFYAVLVSGFVMCLGLLFALVAAVDFSDWFDHDLSEAGKRATFFVGLGLVALGSGGFRPNISPLGAEQVKHLGDSAVDTFFSWLYWVIALGSTLAYTGVAYLEQNISFVWSFLGLFCVLFLTQIIFLASRSLFNRTKPEGSVLRVFFSVLKQAFFTNRGNHWENSSQESEPPGHLDGARMSHGGSHDNVTVDGVWSVLKMIPICALIIMFWAIYSQMQTSYFVQAERMDVRVGGVLIPAAILGSFNNFVMVIMVPVLDRIVYPFMNRIGFPLKPLRRVGLGLLLATASVLVAAVVEIYRKEYMRAPGGSHVQVLANQNFTASSMSVFVQTPQFLLIGVGEVFLGTAILEMGYTQAPKSMQGILTGIFYFSGTGNFVSLGILRLVEWGTAEDPWWGNEINDIKMENLMFLLSGIMFINFLIFTAVAWRYTYSDVTKSPTSEAESDPGKTSTADQYMMYSDIATDAKPPALDSLPNIDLSRKNDNVVSNRYLWKEEDNHLSSEPFRAGLCSLETTENGMPGTKNNVKL